MIVWVFYDISINKSRRKVAILCQQLGLHRVQQSVFLGFIKRKKHLRHFLQDAQKWINPKTDKLYVLPTDKKYYKQIIQQGVKIKKRKVENRRRLHIF